jgi:hypothetical protein
MIHKLEKSVMEVIIPMQAIAVFPFVLWESKKSITFSIVAFTSLFLLRSTREAFSEGERQMAQSNLPLAQGWLLFLS